MIRAVLGSLLALVVLVAVVAFALDYLYGHALAELEQVTRR